MSARVKATLLKCFDDPKVTDVCVNGARTLFFDRGQGLELAASDAPGFTDEELRLWALDAIAQAGKSWDARHPFVDATLPEGFRLHLAFPPVARQGLLVSLRRLPRPPASDPAFARAQAEKRWEASPLFLPLRDIVRRGETVILSGATGSGKTTLANDLLAEVPHSERIIALEDTPELAPAHPHFLSLLGRPANADGCGEVTLRTLLRQTLRMRPDRVILGECRGPEVLELLQALNTGHHGALATLHANSPREALRRIELLCLLSAGSALSLSALRELLALGIQWLAQTKRVGSERRITELWKLDGREGDTLLLRPFSDAVVGRGQKPAGYAKTSE